LLVELLNEWVISEFNINQDFMIPHRISMSAQQRWYLSNGSGKPVAGLALLW
jgi:hypothetical protein